MNYQERTKSERALLAALDSGDYAQAARIATEMVNTGLEVYSDLVYTGRRATQERVYPPMGGQPLEMTLYHVEFKCKILWPGKSRRQAGYTYVLIYVPNEQE